MELRGERSAAAVGELVRMELHAQSMTSRGIEHAADLRRVEGDRLAEPVDRGCEPFARRVPIPFLGCSTALLLGLFRRQFHVLGGYGNRCAMLRHLDMSRPQDAVHDRLTKSLLAEVVMKMAADEAE